jgi:hypothetical protein
MPVLQCSVIGMFKAALTVTVQQFELNATAHDDSSDTLDTSDKYYGHLSALVSELTTVSSSN